MRISKILLTGDFLRPHPANPSQAETVVRNRWFEDLLKPPLSLVTDLPVQVIGCDGPFGLSALYAERRLEPSLDAWAELFATDDLGSGLKTRILERCQNALVIGVELPLSVARLLREAGVPLIDCVPDPHRFLGDVPLAWRSTESAVREALEPFRLPAFEVRRRVAQIKSKTRWMAVPDVPAGATLVLDQVPHDSALIDPRRGRLVGWPEYLDTVAALKADGPVIWRPHPLNPHCGPITEILGEASQTRANFYQLLAHENLARVAAISSGGVVEARAFGKEGVHFLDRYAGIDLPDWATPVPVEGHWLSPHFWSAVLAPLIEVRQDVPVVMAEPNFFRRSLNNDWDFGWIDQIIERRTTRESERRHVNECLEQLTAAVDDLRRQLDATHTNAAGLQRRLDALAAEANDLRLERDELRATLRYGAAPMSAGFTASRSDSP